ncbi:DASS family sodium-coupled anion symporter [Sulfurovum sp. NBC37-1]|uniref:DASS family sodium-coupled anion symporter n=1 Tax=Sulfurovum sp. (strain NBC37-1) TaxID=387093 RepID=UPI0001587732|nr:DASS family sodium-coupled anion symporter [Sulfurovum sp. NBC37-1]BAF71931.1 oxoglutarate:malate translocator [Sulfurovum sp. NBC37-1]
MSHQHKKKIETHWLQLSVLLFGLILWFMPTPSGLETQAWHLFAIFISAIFAVIINAMPIFTSSILALAAVVLTGTLTTKQAYSGFSEGFILLIIVAFLIARGVIKSGLGKRIAFLIIRKFGTSSLKLGYSIVAADMFISPAFPSNTARSGVLFPIVNALAADSGSKVSNGSRKKIGSFLMMTSMAGLTLSSTLWLTAMAANPAGAKMAQEVGVDISYGSWALAASLPVLILYFLVPWVIFKIYPPELKETPEAPQIAQEALDKMGPVHKNEWIMAGVFIGMVFLWVMSGSWGLDKTAVAFLGLGILMLTNIFTLEDLRGEGNALGTLVWFAILYAMSKYLNELGFMGWVGEHISTSVEGFSWPVVYVSLIVGYVLIHYFFVSQTAQMLALFSVFLGVAMKAGVPPELMAYMLLFATNFNAIITPQGSSANVIYTGSGYIEAGEVYKIGGIITAVNTLIFLTVGTAWIIFIV